MHRAKEAMKDVCENFLNKLSEHGDNMTDYDLHEIAETAEDICHIHKAMCCIEELEEVDYNLDHSEARHRRRARHHMGAMHDGMYDAEGHMTEEARRRRAHHMGAEHYEGEAVGYDAHGNKVHYKGEAEVHKNLR